ncbi:MAG: hypothetical protein H7062_03865 [Candidatus Saccharimonas sp.]|nr:hypothetical protein [Planctomycetaceae bacterium]
MLISVGIVLLMMSMFAQIFQIAGDALSKQRGLAENNQRSRTMQTIFKADFDKRTMRTVLPFAAGEGGDGALRPEVEFTKRRGYFYISENNPNNPLDDKLQFTVQSTIKTVSKDDSRYAGRATAIPDGGINQPEFDDGYQFPNSAGSSALAEVTFFVRNGSLYRRVMLIRDSQVTANSNPQPVTNSNVSLFDPSTVNPATNPRVDHYLKLNSGSVPPERTTLWGDYDFSATPEFIAPYAPSPVIDYASFFGTAALDNTGSGETNRSLGLPYHRFGFNFRIDTDPDGDSMTPDGVATADSGRGKEFNRNNYLWNAGDADDPTNTRYLGAFLMQETADLNFGYPQTTCTAPSWTGPTTTNPMSPTTVMLVNRPSDPVAPGLVTDLEGELVNGYSRRGEDLLLSNVHAFDVQVWDDAAQAFVDIGGANATDYSRGGYSASRPDRRLNALYGPIPAGDQSPATFAAPAAPFYQNNVFDTWHPQCDIGGDPGTVTAPEPPYRPRTFIPVTDVAEWAPNTSYSLGARVFPRATAAGVANARHLGDPFYYVCVKNDGDLDMGTGGSTSSPTVPLGDPVWPHYAGGIIADYELKWQAVDNRRPLKAIKIELRFVDTSTQQMRQLTLIQSLTD